MHKNLSVRITQELYEKLRAIAEAEGRYVSGQAAYWLRQAVARYEQEHSAPRSPDAGA